MDNFILCHKSLQVRFLYCLDINGLSELYVYKFLKINNVIINGRNHRMRQIETCNVEQDSKTRKLQRK